MDLSPNIGLTCPVCNRLIPQERIRAPWCACGWRHRRRWGPYFAGFAAIAGAAFFAVWALRPGPIREPGQTAQAADNRQSGPRAPELPSGDGRGSFPEQPPVSAPSGLDPTGSPAAAAQATPSAGQLLKLARSLVAAGSLKEAAGIYRKSILLAPGLVEAHFELGLLCSDLGDLVCAKRELEQALALDPENREILQQIASIFGAAGDVDTAAGAYRKLIQKERLDPRPAAELARMLDTAGRADEAVVAYQDFLNRFPDAPGATEARARFAELIEPPASPGEVRGIAVPVRRSGSAILVTGQVEGAVDVRFLLDTGSTLTIISHELAEELGFKLAGGAQPRVRLETANGPVEAPIVSLETVRLGKAVAHNVRAAVYDINAVDPIDGLLGLSFLDQFRFTIDSQASVMHLEPRR